VPRRKPIKPEEPKWRRFHVKIIVQDILGSIPVQEKFHKFVEQHYMKEFQGEVKPDIEVAEEAGAEVSVKVFRRDEEGIYFVPGQIYGLFKEAIRAAGLSRKLTKVWLRFWVEPRRIHIGRKEPDGTVAIPVRTPYGNAISVHEHIKEAVLEFDIITLDKDFIRWLPLLISYAKRIGLGPGRSKGDYGVIRDIVVEEVEEG